MKFNVRLLIAAASVAVGASAQAQTTLRVAMTLADIPLTTGQPSQGAEGHRFMGLTVYDPLVAWDLSRSDRPVTLRAGLAESWVVDDATKRVWTFKLRRDAKFHDGSLFNADAALWNFDKILNKAAPQYDQTQATQASLYSGSIESYRKLDDFTIAITTKTADAVFPYQLPNLYFSSPARYRELGNDWQKFAERPSGTGPWKFDRLVPRQRAELSRNADYWDKTRVPKTDRLVLMPIPEAATRVAALLSGQVDFIEAPPPDTIARLRQSGMQIVTNVYPHIWPYQLSFVGDSPFKDIRVRRAINLAIDRDGIVKLLGGLAAPAKGMVTAGHPWYGKPSFDIKYDPKEAQRLLAEAGYGPAKPLKIKFVISNSGSGQMQPAPMNEYIQQNLKAIGVDLEFQVLEWEAHRARRRAGADHADNAGIHGLNHSWAFWDPEIALLGVTISPAKATGGFNWGKFNDPRADDLAFKAKNAFNAADQNKILADLHTYVVDQALWIWVVHDLNPRAMSPKVKGFVQAQAWYQDLTSIAMEK